jgi:hypothetical protein
VQIENKRIDSTLVSSPATSCETKLAHEHVATFNTDLALARWTRGGDIPHIPMFRQHALTRGAWYDQAQHEFQDWLDAGGFHQA